MAAIEDDLSQCTALVVDGNPNSRAILVAQMRDLGLQTVVQSTRTVDARRRMESQRFDFVLCEMHFADESTSGQDLLDDLRNNQLLPFQTVFIMITSEANYAKVAEAAESALDGYLLKPHKASHLADRLQVARTRKLALMHIFDAIDAQQFDRASDLCAERFASRGLFWLYAGRLRAELLLRLQRYDDAMAMYQAIAQESPAPWAKLGIARTHLEAGRLGQATSALESLIEEDPSYVEAHDVLGRTHFELGQFDKALATYKEAAAITPSAISRLQNVAMMTYYAGDQVEARRLLDRATRVGLESKLFDPQTVVLLALSRLGIEDRRGLQRCQDDFVRLLEKYPDNRRIRRLAGIVDMAIALQRQETANVLDAVPAMAEDITHIDFDYESAGNLLALLTHMRLRNVHFYDAELAVKTMGMRFCSNRSVTELLAACAAAHVPYARHIRNAQAAVLELAESAMAHSRAGNITTAVQTLLVHAQSTLNVRLIDNAYQLLVRNSTKVNDFELLKAKALQLRTRAGAGNRRVLLGNQRRLPGGLMLRSTVRITGSAPEPSTAPAPLGPR
jgi:CheY-like chemotaxis protein